MKVDKSHLSSQHGYQFRFQLYRQNPFSVATFFTYKPFILISLLPVIMLFKLLPLFVVAYSGVGY